MDLNSPAYKKALRHHLKSKKTPAAEVLPALREQEKAFKAKFPPPSLEDVLDLSWDDTHGESWKGLSSAVDVVPIRCQDRKRAFGIPSLPGEKIQIGA